MSPLKHRPMYLTPEETRFSHCICESCHNSYYFLMLWRTKKKLFKGASRGEGAGKLYGFVSEAKSCVLKSVGGK